MARRVKDAFLDSRNARRKLASRDEPYWRSLDKGFHLGYRRRATGGSWIARRFNESGKYTKKQIGHADDFQDADGVKVLDYSQAQAAARQWFHVDVRKEAGMDEGHDGHYAVADAMRDYLTHYKIEGKGFSVTNAITNAHILPSLGGVRLERLTTKRIAEWIQGVASAPARLRTAKAAQKINTRKLSSDDDAIRSRRATANRVLAVLKAALNYAWREGKVANDAAWRKVKPFKNVAAPVIRYLTEDECVRLVNTCPDDLRQMVQAALFTGCRYSELAHLKAGDLNTDSGTILIRTSKTGKPRHVVLTDEAKKFFESMTKNKKEKDEIFTHADGSLWGKSHQHRPLQDACKRVKIEPAISFHILRHTHGSLLAMKGVPMPVIAKQLGHADTRMTEKHYAHLSPSYVADTIRENFPTLGIVQKSNVHALSPKK